jgi:hypothetical protein
VDGTFPGTAPGSAATIVTESQLHISILFGFLSAVVAAALGRGVTGAQTAGGRAAVVVIFGFLLVLLIARWVIIARSPARLEITEDAIRFVPRKAQVRGLSRAEGDELRFFRRSAGRSWILGLTVTAAGTAAEPGQVLSPLNFFSRKAIRQACRARGWRVAN